MKICEYDKQAADNNDSSPLARTAYSVLVRHLAVCEGYTMAYRYLLEKVGIKSEEIVSEKMRHCWNYVLIIDSWYHVDVTWDDPIFLTRRYQNTISHRYFMMSDDKAKRNKHHGWECRGLPPATNHDFDNRKW